MSDPALGSSTDRAVDSSDRPDAPPREDFPNLAAEFKGRPIVYLDNAATTFKPRTVIEAVTRHYSSQTANVHRGVHHLSEQATAAYEGAREKVRAFIGADETAEIVFTRGSTESINMVARSYGQRFLRPGDEILISGMEHHSNIVPWQMLCEEKGCVLRVIPINDRGEIIWEEFERLLTEKVKLLSVVYISNSLGTVNPVRKMIQAARAMNIPVLVDAAQAVNHRPVNVRDLDCDFLVFSGHKLFGPTGVGVLYGKRALLEEMPPVYGGGDMILSVSFEQTTYNALPYKFEAGTPHIAGVIGLGAAIDYLNGLSWDWITAYERDLLAYGTRRLTEIDGVRLIGTAKEKAAVLSFVVEGIHPHDLGTLLNEESVAVRTGHHCTQPVMKHFGVPATARASLAFYNTRQDLDRLVEAIEKAKDVFR